MTKKIARKEKPRKASKEVKEAVKRLSASFNDPKKESEEVIITKKKYKVVGVSTVSLGFSELVGNLCMYAGFGVLFDTASVMNGSWAYALVFVAIIGLIYCSFATWASLARVWYSLKNRDHRQAVLEPVT